MGTFDIPEELIREAIYDDYLKEHPEIELASIKTLLYLVLDSVGEPVRIKRKDLVYPPEMSMFMQNDIATDDLMIVVERKEPNDS